MTRNYLKDWAMLLLLGCLTQVQLSHAQDIQKQYTVVNRSASAGVDAGSIHLDEKDGDGVAWIKGKSFSTGTIELDIKGKDKPQGSFIGMAFHGSNDSTFEVVYFRPFNFRSTDPVRKGHAVQYVASP